MARTEKANRQDRNTPHYRAFHVSEGENGFWAAIGAATFPTKNTIESTIIIN